MLQVIRHVHRSVPRRCAQSTALVSRASRSCAAFFRGKILGSCHRRAPGCLSNQKTSAPAHCWKGLVETVKTNYHDTICCTCHQRCRRQCDRRCRRRVSKSVWPRSAGLLPPSSSVLGRFSLGGGPPIIISGLNAIFACA